ncbi:DoxX family protein [Ruania alba]|uniref:Uncharacterized membrane protein n=1 Tax=Ruania alba TaxID=648782 RepID=A0A1H5KAI8_9MICO|nr:DoxX family protein [Ruania alba]SEE61051.1 Uncharacterized membrane protein [Ruania alba]
MRRELWAVIGPFAVSGVLHLMRPGLFESIIPAPLRRWKRELVILSGVAECSCAAGLLHPRTRRVAGWTSAALLVAVWPANMQMSADLASWAWRHGDAGSWVRFAVSVARLPLQVPVIRIALRAGRTDPVGITPERGRRNGERSADSPRSGA